MELKRGALVGQEFVVERTLARESSAIVLTAKQPRLNRLVAIKVFLEVSSDRRFLAAFARASQINSAFVPKLFDLGTLPDGKPYLVMEYVDGEDLGKVVSRGALTSAEAVQYVLQACEAVASTHSVGMAHRCLKTSSLIATRQANGAPLVKVLNCGLVNIGSPSTERQPTMTEYLAPEQVVEERKVDFRCDVWALGVILYELLTGQAPFMSGNAARMAKRILEESPPPLRTGRPDVSEPVEEIVRRCLEKAPEARFQTIADLATALGPFGTVHTIALPVRIVQMKGAARRSSAPPTPIGDQPGGTLPPPPQSDGLDAYPPPLLVAPLQFSAPESDDALFRKVTSDGRIELLDADAAALAVRERRVAAEAGVLARDARAKPAPAPVEEADVDAIRVLGDEEPAEAREAPRPQASQSPPAWRPPRIVVLLAGVIAAGLIIGVAVRIVATESRAPEDNARRKPREIIVEDPPSARPPMKRSLP